MSEADDYLEEYYDAIVLSTGLGSSILAAALAKAGKSVLYLDCHEYYGQETASFSFTQLLDWAEKNSSSSSRSSSSSLVGTLGDNHANGGPPSRETGPGADGEPYSFDSATAGIAIARAHVRNEARKERDAAEAAAAAAKAAEEEEAVGSSAAAAVQEVAEAGGGGTETSATGSATGGGGNGEEVSPTAEQEQDSQQGGSPKKAVGEDHSPGAAKPEEREETDAGQGEREKQEATGTDQDKQEPAAEDEAAAAAVAAAKAKEQEEEKQEEALREAAAAEARLRSQDLHLLPLSYHGCRTRAGPPSDACISERRRRKAAEESAAAAGRFLGGKQPRPSHPTWEGRPQPSKEEGGTGDGGGPGEGEEEAVHPSFWGYRTERRPNAADLVRLSRSFNLDLTSQVLLATGPAVDALVDSGVANYLEFKDMQALYLASDAAAVAGDRRPAARGAEKGRAEGGIRPRGEGPSVSGRRDENCIGGGDRENAAGGGEGGSGSGSGGGSAGSLQVSRPSPTAVAAAVATATAPGPGLSLSRVPCSKADVFGTKLLTPLEKRRLMKFLLFASDWGLQRAGEDVLARNEAGLGQGRSLRRPQNREAASGEFGAERYAGRPFAEFLRSCGLPERVRAMITHALALLPGGDGDGGDGEQGHGGGGVTTEEGLEAVNRHLSALGRFGETAFITPLYGLGELSQSFCRMAAVHGAICMLRRQLRGAVVDHVTGRCVGIVDDAGRAFACSSLVVGGEFFATSPTTNTDTTANNPNQPQLQPTPSPTPVLNTTATSPPPPTTTTTTTTTTSPSSNPPAVATSNCPRGRRLLRRIVLASGPVAPEARGRGLCVLPPGLESVGNTAAVHVVSLDEGTMACPGGLEGACVLHLTTTAPADSAWLSEGAGTAVGVGGFGVKQAPAAAVNRGDAAAEGREGEGEGEVGQENLSSSSDAAADGGPVVEDENGSQGVLGRAARELLVAAGVEELWSLGFSWDIQEPPRPEDLPSNVVVCERLGQELYLHGVVVQAERAFARLCPGKPFWPPPPRPDDEDEYQVELLRAAVSAVSDKTKDAQEPDPPQEEGGRGATGVDGEEGGEGEEDEEAAGPLPSQEEGAPKEGAEKDR
eukprot:g12662.t1